MFKTYYNTPISIYEVENNKAYSSGSCNKLQTITQNIINIYQVINLIKNINSQYYEVVNNGQSFKLFLQIDTNKLTKSFTIRIIIDEFIKYLSSSKITKIVFNQDYKPMSTLINTHEILINRNRCYVIFPYITTNWKHYNIILNKFMSNEHPIVITPIYYLPYIIPKNKQECEPPGETNGQRPLFEPPGETIFRYIIHAIPREHVDVKYNKLLATA